MAFNPFHGFRKHRRVIFAVLTIICMITFILSGGFGRGDALESLMNLFGRGSKQGDVVTVLHGDKIYSGEISDYARQRQLASDFAKRSISESTFQTGVGLAAVISKPMPADTENIDLLMYRYQVERIFFEMLALGKTMLSEDAEKTLTERMTKPGLEARRKQALQALFSSFTPGKRLQELNEQSASFGRLRANLARKNMEEEVKVIDGILSMIALDLWTMTVKDPGSALVFGGTTKQQDMLDFIMWLKQADTLGIKLTDEDVRASVNRLTPIRPMLSGTKSVDQNSIQDIFKKEGKEARDIDLKILYRALGNELRVALAQGVVLGEEPGILAYRPNAFRDPIAVTPLEYVDYYREQRQTAQVVLLPVPVSAFATPDLPLPSARQIEEMYEEYKNVDPMPWSATPAFKVPHRVRLQWVSMRTVKKTELWNAAQVLPLAGHIRVLEDPRVAYYENRAQQKLAAHIASSAALKDPWQIVSSGASGEPSGVMMVARSMNIAHDGLRDSFPLPSLFENNPSLSFATAANLPAAAASAAAAFAPAANPASLTGLFAWQGSAVLQAGTSQDAPLKEELTKRAQIAAGFVGSSAAAGLLGSPSAGRLATLAPFLRDSDGNRVQNELPGLATTVPLMAVQAQVCEKIRSELASRVREEDREEFKKKLEEAKGEKEPAEKAVAEYVKKMRLENAQGESQHDDDRYSLAKDPGLKPLADSGLDAQVFDSGGLYTPSNLAGEVLVWKTKNEPARTPELKEIRDEVKKAWQFREARRKASEAAAKIRDDISGKDSKAAVKALEKLLEQNPSWGSLIRLDEVTRQEKLPTRTADGNHVYDPYKKYEDDVPYPTAGFLGELLRLKEKEAVVLNDRPEKNYYVAYTVKRMPEPTVEEALLKTNRANMLKALEESQKKQRQQELLAELRRLAAKGGQLDARSRFILEPGIKSDESSAE